MSSQGSVKFPMLGEDNITLTEAVMSITTVNTAKKSFLRAVLAVRGESKERYFGTRHCSALESAKKLLSRYEERIAPPTQKFVLGGLQKALRSRKCGVQPSSSRCGSPRGAKLCRGLRTKRKLKRKACKKNLESQNLGRQKRWKSVFPQGQ